MAYEIASITKAKKKTERLVVEFTEGHESVEIAAEVALRFPTAVPGAVVDDDEIARWLEADEAVRCRLKAWSLLARRPRARLELERALKQGKFSAPIIQQTLAGLEEKHYLDDAAYARLFAEEAKAKKSGPRLVLQQLATRGIRGETAQEAIAPIADSASQREAAQALLVKWNRRTKPEDSAKRAQAAAGFLLRRGFDQEIVWEAVRAVLKHEE